MAMSVRDDTSGEERGSWQESSGTRAAGQGNGRAIEGRSGISGGLGGRDLTRLIEALPPHAPGAEMSLLGAMLWDHSVIPEVIGIVSSGDDFYKAAHQVLFQTMIDLYDKHGALDGEQLTQRLVDMDLLEDTGGIEYIVELAESVPSASNAPYYARIVREKATLRELIEAAGSTLVEAHTSTEDAQEVLEQAEQRIFNIAQKREHASAQDLGSLLDEAIRALEENEGRSMTGLPSGFGDLDELTNGLQPGELIILAARPSMGKTAVALNMIEHVAMAGHPAAIFSLEMGRQQLVQRLICAHGGIDSQRLRRNMLRTDDFSKIFAACDELKKSPLYIDDTPGLSLLQLRSKARRMKERFGIELLVIDYLQLMHVGGRPESRQIEVSEMSRGVKAMARELDVPVICLSQLNRAAEQREGHRPRLSDLRESGSIEQDADVVMMLHREEYYHRHDPDWAVANPERVGVGEIIIAKQRNGPTGTVHLVWDAASTRYRDRSHMSAEQEFGAGGFEETTLPH
ncbi:MAG: replicative DNA helicase [Planctomycetota bacterium]|nr:replicative DNA helicase [Planctomycetota bacterium]